MVKLIRRAIRSALDRVVTPYLGELNLASKTEQMFLALKYREILQERGGLPQLRDVGFRVFSQNDEDGILLFIFSLISAKNRRSVEICAGDGIECNTANLIVNHGWTGLLFDGDLRNVLRGRRFYSRCPDTRIFPPGFVHAWIEAENVIVRLRRKDQVHKTEPHEPPSAKTQS